MSLESPLSILYNTEGYEISLSQSMPIASTQPGLMIMGSSSVGATFIKMENDGTVHITGSISSVAAGNQDVTVTNLWSYVTGTNNGLIVNQGLSASNYADSWKVVLTNASGSYMGLSSSNPLWTTISGTIDVKQACATNTTVTGVLATATNYTVFAQNTQRTKATFYKTGPGTAYIKLGSVASSTSYTIQLTANAYWEVPDLYCGIIDIVFSSAGAGSIVATEITY